MSDKHLIPKLLILISLVVIIIANSESFITTVFCTVQLFSVLAIHLKG